MSGHGRHTLDWYKAVVYKLGGEEAAEKLLRGDLVIKDLKAVALTLNFLVNYNRSVEDGIKSGNYVWADPDINSKNFPAFRTGEISVYLKLLHFNREMTKERICREMDYRNLRPARLPELLALGETYPDLQTKFPIVSLGAVRQSHAGHRRVAVLFHDDRGRKVGFSEDSHIWNEYCRFAAVPQE